VHHPLLQKLLHSGYTLVIEACKLKRGILGSACPRCRIAKPHKSASFIVSNADSHPPKCTRLCGQPF